MFTWFNSPLNHLPSPQDWKDLTELKGFGDYIQILNNKEPSPVKYLLRKWGENPKWTLEALIAALDLIDRRDAALYVQSYFFKKEEWLFSMVHDIELCFLILVL